MFKLSMKSIFKELSIVILIAIFLTSFEYYIDSDPPYPSIFKTIKEFCIITLMFFTVLLLPYSIFSLLRMFIRYITSVRDINRKIL